MFSIQALVVGLILLTYGVVSLKFNYTLVGFTGHIGFVEKYLGYGSTYAFMKFVSVLCCIAGFLAITGLYSPVVDWLLSPLAVFFPKNN
ncbi:MAG TPA: hypothetical protein VLF21_02340 [Candidatus Saccharimonadales bacterium]|nr:hypothetical protein [Candidatus Saccharimonadales bacterium]